jgi:hypothetical protein
MIIHTVEKVHSTTEAAQELDHHINAGWEFVTSIPIDGGEGTIVIWLVFKKEEK